MAWLTHDKFIELGGNSNVTDSEFNGLLNKAVAFIQPVTNWFYPDDNALNADLVVIRKNAFIMALVLEIDYLKLAGTSAFSVARQAQSQSIGETSVSYGNAGFTDSSGKAVMVPPDVYDVLEGTGLLYRGACSC